MSHPNTRKLVVIPSSSIGEFIKNIYSILSFFSVLLLVVACPCRASHAVILQYHHVSDNTPNSTSISPIQFRQHMQYVSQHYHVMPLDKVIEALQQHKPLPDNTVAITFDDGYEDILTNGTPILKEYKFPYTVFINPDQIGQRKDQLTWQQVKSMAQHGALFANHTNGHIHLLQTLPGETHQAWLIRVTDNIQQAEQQLQQQLGYSLKYLAYPYGEYNQALQQWLGQHGYVGFGQQSGAIDNDSTFGALPRYPAAGRFANLASLKVKLASLPMPVTQDSIDNPVFAPDQPFPIVTIQVDSDDFDQGQLRCYYQGNAFQPVWQDHRFSVQLPGKLKPGRSRLNCTVPSHSKNGRYYWYSQPFFVPTGDNQWLE